MFDRLEIRILPPGPRIPAELRFWVNGEDLVAQTTGPDGLGRWAALLFPHDRPSPLHATGKPHRVELGEPECTGGCCGYLSATVQRFGPVVRWADWEVPYLQARPPEFDFEAEQYDAELARVEADLRRQEPS
ncbi:hypothetical protein BX285_7223 [Streptomyces sp. 1114.5]|uniref:hypothetical protein n=1 Tax=unclassified Streptomyces TaxID=2593676 RepID=UPI000BD8B075|nr:MULTISPECIES: hypothetical protein [unclassified Streptomyces]RKT08855.1 hypothetical protein BX285_7223 [Streptomyces sp. 1114.5]SOB79184.1 hypothetical protein SAMN06272789_0299 [Streptomyces sp. 1331.2]